MLRKAADVSNIVVVIFLAIVIVVSLAMGKPIYILGYCIMFYDHVIYFIWRVLRFVFVLLTSS